MRLAIGRFHAGAGQGFGCTDLAAGFLGYPITDAAYERAELFRLADAPTEHLERSLVLLGAGRSAARRLVELFQRARFSLQEIDEPVRQAALDALAAVRRDLEPA